MLLIVTFVSAVPLIVVVTYPIYTVMKISRSERPAAATLIALPGILLDVLSLSFFGSVFPNLAALSASTDALFGAWVLLAHGLILLSGFFPRSSVRTAREG